MPHRSLLRSLTVGLILIPCAASTARAVDHQIVYAETYAVGDGSRCNPWSSVDGTGGIHDALAQCTPSSDGCTVILPKGYVRITSTIDASVGGRLSGLVLRGHGSGEKSTDPANGNSSAGTKLVWWTDAACPAPGGMTSVAPANGTVLLVQNLSWSRFEDFAIDGGGTTPATGIAGRGIQVTSTGAATQMNIFDNIFIRDINGSPGIGIDFGPPDTHSYQTSETTFDHIIIQYVNTGIRHYGSQSTNQIFRNTRVASFRDYGLDIVSGHLITDNAAFNSYAPGAPACVPTGPSQSCADVIVRQTAIEYPAWLEFENNYHETFRGVAYLYEPGIYRNYPTTLLNTRIMWAQNGGNIIDYQQTGHLNLIGCTFDTSGLSGQNGKVFIKVPSSGAVATITSLGNFWVDNGTGGTRMEIDPTSVSSLISNDDPTKLHGLTAGGATHLFKGVGLMFESGSMNWTNFGGTTALFTQHLDTSIFPYVLKLKSPNGDLAWWTQAGNLHLQQATGAVEFEGASGGGATSLKAADPGLTSPMVTLPARTGTVLVSGDTLTGHVTGTLAADGVTSTTITAQTSAFVFSNIPSTFNAQRWFGPNAGTIGMTADAVSVPVPAMTARSLWCKLTAVAGGGKGWILTAQTGSGTGTPLLSCPVTSGSVCNATGSASWTAGSNLSLRATPTGPNPPLATLVFCSLGVSPN